MGISTYDIISKYLGDSKGKTSTDEVIAKYTSPMTIKTQPVATSKIIPTSKISDFAVTGTGNMEATDKGLTPIGKKTQALAKQQVGEYGDAYNKEQKFYTEAMAGKHGLPAKMLAVEVMGAGPSMGMVSPAKGIVEEGANILKKAGVIGESTTPTAGKLIAERGFPSTVKASTQTKPELSKAIPKMNYTVRNSEDLMIQAKNLVKENPDEALRLVNSKVVSDKVNAIGMEMIKAKQAAGDIQGAIDLVEKIAPKFTEAGRAGQIASMFDALTPDGVLRFAQRQINKANEAMGKIDKTTGALKGNAIKLSEKDAKEILDLAQKNADIQLREMRLPKDTEQSIKQVVADLKNWEGEKIKLSKESDDAIKQMVSGLKHWEGEKARLSKESEQSIKDLVGGLKSRSGEKIKLSQESEQSIKDLVGGLKNWDGEKVKLSREGDVAVAKLMAKIQATIPSTLWRKVSSLQTIGQLLNPKTVVRNVVGNTMFAGLDNISNVVAIPIDAAMGLKTGKRTISMPSVRTQARGAVEGFGQGLGEAFSGIDTQFGNTGKFELGKSPAFRVRSLEKATAQNVGKNVSIIAENTMGWLERTMGASLKSFDRAGYMAAYKDSLRQQMKSAKVFEPTEEMIQNAHYDGLYRTFQDDSAVAKQMVQLKKWMNGGKEFGLGDIVLKYPKTPGNILDRALNYTPVGFAQTLLGVRGGATQRQTAMGLSRALTGTVGLGIATTLATLGIISAAPSTDKDVRGIQKENRQGAYQVNMSALQRLISSGFNPEQGKPKNGDTLATYDWAQPIAVNLAIGAKAAEAMKKRDINSFSELIQKGAEIAAESSNTIIEQPMVTGVRTLAQSRDIASAGASIAKSAAPSFVPTSVSMIAQKKNNQARETYDPNIFKNMTNQIKAKIPGLRETLPPRISVYGEPTEQYADKGNTFFNVFFSPAFVTKLKQSPESKFVLDLVEKTGEKSHLPHVAPRDITIGSVKIPLEQTQINRMQTILGKNYKGVVGNMIKDPEFKKLSSDEQVSEINSMLRELSTFAKVTTFKGMPETKRQELIIKMLDQAKTSDQKGKAFSELVDNGYISEIEADKIYRIYNKK